MNLTIEYPSAVSVVITGNFSANDVSAELDKLIRQYRDSLTVPGFRPGRAPKSLIVTKFGDVLKPEIEKALLRLTLEKAFDKEPSAYPLLFMDITEQKFTSFDEPARLKIYIEVRPEVKLNEYKGFELERAETPVSDEEIDRVVEDFRIRNSVLESRDRPVEEGDYVETKVLIPDGGDEPIPMLLPLDDPEFVMFFGNLIGKSKGDVIEKDIDFPEGFPDRRLQGKSGHFRIEITNVYQQVKPELNEEFFRKMGKPEGYTVEQFRKEVADYIRSEKSMVSESELREKLIDRLIEKNPVEIPPKFLEQEVERKLSRKIRGNDLSEDELEKLRNSIITQVKRQIAYEFIIDAIASAESIELTEQEIEDGMAMRAQLFNAPIEEVRKFYNESPERLEELKTTLLRKKTLEFILSTCKIVDGQTESDGE